MNAWPMSTPLLSLTFITEKEISCGKSAVAVRLTENMGKMRKSKCIDEPFRIVKSRFTSPLELEKRDGFSNIMLEVHARALSHSHI
jgi:hypothetical protein